MLVGQVVRARPVEGQVREGALAAPARGHVQVVDELLHALNNVVVLHVVQAHEGRHVRVEGGERLGTRPLVLEGAEEIDDLAARRREVLGRGRGDRAAHTVEALLDEALEGPARAVPGEHVEVVDVVVALAVRGADLGSVDVFKPVVGDDLARRVQDQATERVPLVGVGVDSPVGAVEVLLHGCDGVDVVAGCGHGPCPVLISDWMYAAARMKHRVRWCGCSYWLFGYRCTAPVCLDCGQRAQALRPVRHVVNTPHWWGEAVALWVVALAFARNEHPLGRFAHRITLDVVFGPNTLHHI